MLYLILHSPLRKREWGFVLLVKCTKICLMFIYGCSLIVWINCAARSRASDMFTVHRMARLRSDPVASHRCRVLHEHRFISNLLAKPVEAMLPSAGHRFGFGRLLDQLCASSGCRTGLNRFTQPGFSQAIWEEVNFGKEHILI